MLLYALVALGLQDCSIQSDTVVCISGIRTPDTHQIAAGRSVGPFQSCALTGVSRDVEHGGLYFKNGVIFSRNVRKFNLICAPKRGTVFHKPVVVQQIAF